MEHCIGRVWEQNIEAMRLLLRDHFWVKMILLRSQMTEFHKYHLCLV